MNYFLNDSITSKTVAQNSWNSRGYTINCFGILNHGISEKSLTSCTKPR